MPIDVDNAPPEVLLRLINIEIAVENTGGVAMMWSGPRLLIAAVTVRSISADWLTSA
jgi:hypothetical protein